MTDFEGRLRDELEPILAMPDPRERIARRGTRGVERVAKLGPKVSLNALRLHRIRTCVRPGAGQRANPVVHTRQFQVPVPILGVKLVIERGPGMRRHFVTQMLSGLGHHAEGILRRSRDPLRFQVQVLGNTRDEQGSGPGVGKIHPIRKTRALAGALPAVGDHDGSDNPVLQ